MYPKNSMSEGLESQQSEGEAAVQESNLWKRDWVMYDFSGTNMEGWQGQPTPARVIQMDIHKQVEGEGGIVETDEVIQARLNELTDYVLDKLVEATGVPKEEYMPPKFTVYPPDENAKFAGQQFPYSGGIELYYRFPVAGNEFSATVIHELVHYYASRWIRYNRIDPDKSEVVAFGLGTKCIATDGTPF